MATDPKKNISGTDYLGRKILNAVLENAMLEPLSAPPASPKEGQFYYDSTKEAFGLYEGGKWHYMGKEESGSDDYVKKSGDTMTGALTAPRFVSTQPTGTAPMQVESTTVVPNLNADTVDGVHISDLNLRRYYIISLVDLSSSLFYPVTINTNGSDYVLDCEIHSPRDAGSAPFNQNFIRFLMTNSGWNDLPKRFSVLLNGNYSDTEITIGSIGYSNSQGCVCVWLRGGFNYRFAANLAPTLHTADYAVSNAIFTVGEGLSGGTNTGVTIIWTNDSTRNNKTLAKISDTVANANSLGGSPASDYMKKSGTSSQFLKADGSIDANKYLAAESLAHPCKLEFVRDGYKDTADNSVARLRLIQNLSDSEDLYIFLMRNIRRRKKSKKEGGTIQPAGWRNPYITHDGVVQFNSRWKLTDAQKQGTELIQIDFYDFISNFISDATDAEQSRGYIRKFNRTYNLKDNKTKRLKGLGFAIFRAQRNGVYVNYIRVSEVLPIDVIGYYYTRNSAFTILSVWG